MDAIQQWLEENYMWASPRQVGRALYYDHAQTTLIGPGARGEDALMANWANRVLRDLYAAGRIERRYTNTDGIRRVQYRALKRPR